ncbi:hypothetical protein H0H87_008734 [Tephrocybe sp. NHM501043]|nr:hypothetical protein H0H87_008734 [Tephrocybe sp. NHM501043]
MLDSDDDSDDTDSEKRLSSQRHSPQSHSDTNLESLPDSEPPSFKSEDPPTPTTAAFPPTPSRSSSPTAQVAVNGNIEEEKAHGLLPQVMGNFIPSEAASAQADTTLDTLSPSTIRGHLKVKLPRSPFTSSAVSLGLPSVGSSAPIDQSTSAEPKIRTRSRGLSLTASLSVPDINLRGQGSSASPPMETRASVPPVPFLLRTIPKPPVNPRDHSLLEAIYSRLLDSRFINDSPLALLANYIGFYFKDVRTHPPLQYHFPAVPHRSQSGPGETEDGNDSDLDEDSDGARDAILPNSIAHTVKKRNSRPLSTQPEEEEHLNTEEDRYVGVHSLIRHSSPYITIDESRASALSPSIKGMFPDIASSRLQRRYLLPNTTMHLDLKTLNLHLALRAAEIVACSESMWELVLERKAREAKEREASGTPVRAHRSGSGSIEMPRRSTVSTVNSRDSDTFDNAILDLTREEFDGLICKFEM